MCKYSLTKIAYFANECHRKLRIQSELPNSLYGIEAKIGVFGGKKLLLSRNPLKMLATFLRDSWINFKKSTLSLLLIAIDNSTSLHTICAATITIASGEFKCGKLSLQLAWAFVF